MLLLAHDFDGKQAFYCAAKKSELDPEDMGKVVEFVCERIAKKLDQPIECPIDTKDESVKFIYTIFLVSKMVDMIEVIDVVDNECKVIHIYSSSDWSMLDI